MTPLVPVTFRISSENQEGVERVMREDGSEFGDVVRTAIDEALKRWEKISPNGEVLLRQLRSLGREELMNIFNELLPSAPNPQGFNPGQGES